MESIKLIQVQRFIYIHLTNKKRALQKHEIATPQPSKGKEKDTMQLTKEQFKTIRTELQYTQKEFAEMLGLTIRMITYYESGQRPVSKTVSILTKRIYQDEK